MDTFGYTVSDDQGASTNSYLTVLSPTTLTSPAPATARSKPAELLQYSMPVLVT